MAAPAPEQSQSYTFASEPRAIRARSKFREPVFDDAIQANVMYDRRVVRGNTYAAIVMPSAQREEILRQQKEQEAAKKRILARQKRAAREAQMRPQTPEPVDGRKHADIQTENYLEELSDRVPEKDVDVQTDPFLDRPPSPLFIPMRDAVDVETQVLAGDLFDFDLEVEPILEVLTGKTLEQGMIEVMEEEELAAMKQHQEEFEQIRNAELAEVQRLEAAEKRRHEEKERRLAQERGRLQRERAVNQKVASRAYSKRYLGGLRGSVFSNLWEQGFFYDPVVKEVEDTFMPWLNARVGKNLDTVARSREIVPKMIEEALTRGRMEHHEALRKADERNQLRKKEEDMRQEQDALKAEEDERTRKAEELRLNLAQ